MSTSKPNRPKTLRVTMPDHTVWDIPVEVIARNRAKHYARDYEGDVERCLTEEVWPLFEASPYEIKDWAANNMNWSDLEAHAVRVPTTPPPCDYEAEWGDAEKEVIP